MSYIKSIPIYPVKKVLICNCGNEMKCSGYAYTKKFQYKCPVCGEVELSDSSFPIIEYIYEKPVTPLSNLDLSVRAWHALKKNGINTIEELLEKDIHSMNIPSIVRDEIINKLEELKKLETNDKETQRQTV